MNEHKELGLKDNERLEFLGDAVLELTVSDYLYRKSFPTNPKAISPEFGQRLFRQRPSAFSKEAHFDRYIKLGKGEEKAGARKRLTLLEDLFEAFNGALYLDQGRDANIRFAQQIIFPKIDAGEFSADQDHKTALQEVLQQNGDVAIVYHLLDEQGPAHERQVPR